MSARRINRVSGRRIKVTVNEKIIEDTVIEVDVPDNVDLADEAQVAALLERVWCEGEYKKIDLESELQVTDREFSEPVLLT